MLPRSLLSLVVASILVVRGSSQYVDLFTGLQNLFQPYQFDGFREVTTKRVETRKHTNKQNINPQIVFRDDDIPRKPHTTSKPRKTTRPNSSQSVTKRPAQQTTKKNDRKSQRVIDNTYFDNNKQRNTNQNRNPQVNNIGNNQNRNPDVHSIKVPQFTTNWGNNREKQNGFTTYNPILNRPGVRPAPVDESKPPITNRPVENGYGFGVPQDDPELEIGPDEDDMTAAEKREYIEVAEEMCDKYKALNVKKVVALPLVPSPQGVEVNVSDCTPINIPLIIGGTVSKIEEFPHMALVGWRKVQSNGYSWKCGGSLISDQYVLTAGHCTYHDKDSNVASGPPHAVQLGSTYVDGPGAVVVKTSRVIRHPKYKTRRSYFDVALIYLVSRVSFSDVIRPACLGVPPPVGRPIIATGWGRTEFGGSQSLELRSVSLPIWDLQDCQQVWGTSLKLPNGPTSESHVCAGERNGGKDTCQGDSGGPAQVQDGCVWRIVAVTSSGRSCGAPDTPALYAKIPRAFISAQVYGKRRSNRYNQNGNSGLNNRDSVNRGNQNNGNHYQNNRGNGNSQNGWNSQSNQNNQNNYQQNNRENNNVNQGTWTNSNANYQDSRNQNQNGYQQNNRDSTNSQSNWNTPSGSYQNNQNSYQNNWNANVNTYNPTTQNSYNQNQNVYYQNNRDTYQSTQNNYDQQNSYSGNNYNRQNVYQNNRNSYATESWNNPDFNSGYDYSGFGVTERPWFS